MTVEDPKCGPRFFNQILKESRAKGKRKEKKRSRVLYSRKMGMGGCEGRSGKHRIP